MEEQRPARVEDPERVRRVAHDLRRLVEPVDEDQIEGPAAGREELVGRRADVAAGDGVDADLVDEGHAREVGVGPAADLEEAAVAEAPLQVQNQQRPVHRDVERRRARAEERARPRPVLPRLGQRRVARRDLGHVGEGARVLAVEEVLRVAHLRRQLRDGLERAGVEHAARGRRRREERDDLRAEVRVVGHGDAAARRVTEEMRGQVYEARSRHRGDERPKLETLPYAPAGQYCHKIATKMPPPQVLFEVFRYSAAAFSAALNGSTTL